MRWPFRISIRLLAFNLLLVFLPAGGMLILDTYERHLLEAQERTMAQEGRLLAAALEARDRLEAEDARRILTQLDRRHLARLRVVDADGTILVDSAALGPQREPGQDTAYGFEDSPRDTPLYRLFSEPIRLFRSVRPSGDRLAPPVEAAGIPDPTVADALAGRYGATTRIGASDGARLVVLHIAIPVRVEDRVAGAVVVSQSTSRVLAALYAVRLDVAGVFLVSLGAAVVLTLLSAFTIVRPLGRLRRRAGEILDRRGRLRGGFEASLRRDEIGDLERALAGLTQRLSAHLKATEHLTADLTHEFRNPLASIRAATEVALDEPDRAERQHLLESVARDVSRLERLLSGAREVSQIDARLEAEDRENVALGPILEGLAEGFRLQQPDDGPDIVLEFSDREDLVVHAAADRLSQVFENLIANAVGFSPPGETVTVSARRTGAQCVVEVLDRGPGIPPEHLDRVFQRFFSFRADTERNGPHMGLGLAIVKAIVEGYGGSVTAGHRDGGGARFTVALPAEPGSGRSRPDGAAFETTSPE